MLFRSDVIRSIQECQRRFQTRRIGFVGFYNAFNGIEQFSGMFGCDIRVYIPECAAEIRHALELAKQDGCDVIVGGYSVQQDAGLLGLPAILLRTGRETYAQSLEEAIRTVTLVQQERIRTETYKIITESVKDGLLYVDASGIIRLDNPAACLMRDAPLKDVPLETAFPCMKDSFSRAMRDCAEIQGEVRKVRGVSITFDCTPVADVYKRQPSSPTSGPSPHGANRAGWFRPSTTSSGKGKPVPASTSGCTAP